MNNNTSKIVQKFAHNALHNIFEEDEDSEEDRSDSSDSDNSGSGSDSSSGSQEEEDGVIQKENDEGIVVDLKEFNLTLESTPGSQISQLRDARQSNTKPPAEMESDSEVVVVVDIEEPQSNHQETLDDAIDKTLEDILQASKSKQPSSTANKRDPNNSTTSVPIPSHDILKSKNPNNIIDDKIKGDSSKIFKLQVDSNINKDVSEVVVSFEDDTQSPKNKRQNRDVRRKPIAAVKTEFIEEPPKRSRTPSPNMGASSIRNSREDTSDSTRSYQQRHKKEAEGEKKRLDISETRQETKTQDEKKRDKVAASPSQPTNDKQKESRRSREHHQGSHSPIERNKPKEEKRQDIKEEKSKGDNELAKQLEEEARAEARKRKREEDRLRRLAEDKKKQEEQANKQEDSERKKLLDEKKENRKKRRGK